MIILTLLSDERIYLDFRGSSRYVKEAEKLKRNDSKITLHIRRSEEKLKAKGLGSFLWRIIYILTKHDLTLRHRTYAINQTDKDMLE